MLIADITADASQVHSREPVFHVDTKDGPVDGILMNGAAVFFGIPYAAPPVGELRWRPPQNPAPWTQALRRTAYAPTCAQVTTLGVFAGPPSENEDCLYLNVFAPKEFQSKAEKRPVIVWIHGGADLDGESNDYNGAKLAVSGDTIVVTFNYRLGLFGFLAHPALDSEGHPFANYGILDQQAVLRWVRENIKAFGGDPGRVTLSGQSAGSVDTNANVISPLATGLFHRAIFQSIILEPAPLAVAEAKGKAFATAAGCDAGANADVAKCLRNLTPAQILKLSGTKAATGPYTSFIIRDGTIIPRDYATAFKTGDFNHVPIMNGTTRDEGNFFIAVGQYFMPSQAPVAAEDISAFVTRTYSSAAFPAGTVDKVLSRYPMSDYNTPQLALAAIQTDAYSCRIRNADYLLSKYVPIYAYEFQDRTAPSYFPNMPGYQPLAYHTSDIQYLFPHFHGGPDGLPHELNDAQKKLSDELVKAWTEFARTGNPNGHGDSPWPRFTTEKPIYLAENIPTLSTFSDDAFSAAHKCDLWDTVINY
jgi:para-nitrobenzyl esterase